MKYSYCVTAALLLAGVASLCQTTPPSPAPGSEDPRSRGAAFAQSQPAEFSWLMFLNLVSPAKPGVRGVRDPTKQVGAPVATVWETWKNAANIYLPDGRRPSAWSNLWELPMPPGSALAPSAASFKALGPVDSTWIHFLSENMMIDGQDIVNAQSQEIRYDVRANKATFDYVVNNPAKFELFNLDGQERALASSTFQFAFPLDAMETKSSWRILGPTDDPSRYWTAYVVYVDVQNRPMIARAGLTGLHFASKILPNWFWATFEQIDNPTTSFQYFLRQKGSAIGANPTYNNAATPQNTFWAKQLQGTKWQYYKLMGWETNFTDGSHPNVLANSQMESYFETDSSCITCHSISNIGPPTAVRLNFWNTAGGNITGYTGDVNFQQLAQQQFPGLTFKQMDYVWSLRLAKAKQGK